MICLQAIDSRVHKGVEIQRGANHKWHDGSRKIKLHQNAKELNNTVDRVRRNCKTHSSKGSRWACNHGIDTSKVMVVTENWTHEDIWDVSCLHDIGKWWNMLLLWRLKNHEEAIRCYTAAMNNYCPTLRSKLTYWTKSWTRRNQTNLAWSRVWIRGSKSRR